MTDTTTVATQPRVIPPARNGYATWPIKQRVQYCEMLAGAADLIPRGLFDRTTGRPSAAKIFLVLETGVMLHLEPMAAMQGIDVIEGRATITPRLFTGLVRAAGHKLRIVESGTIEGGDYRVDVTLIRCDDPEYPITAHFSPVLAARAGLCTYVLDPRTGKWTVQARAKGGGVLPWEAYSEDMCLWRALGRLGRKGAADVMSGIGYFPEELEAVVNEEGERIVTTKEDEDALIAEFRALTDKADMARVWQEHHFLKEPEPEWTDRVDAEFTAHLSTLTIDSRQQGITGGPGHTGDPELDGQAEPAAAEPPVDLDAATVILAETRPADPPAEVESIDDRVAREEAEELARADAEHQAYLDSLEAAEPDAPAPARAPRPAGKPAPGLDMSALNEGA